MAIYGEANYYPRLGFKRATLHDITDPKGNVYDPLMVYELRKDGLKGIHGKLFESPTFEKSNDENAVDSFGSFRAVFCFPSWRQQYHFPELQRWCNHGGFDQFFSNRGLLRNSGQ